MTKHKTEYDEYHEPVNTGRIFGECQMGYAETLLAIRAVVAEKSPWTDSLEPKIDAVLREEYSPSGWAKVSEQTVAVATKDFDEVYRMLKLMADTGQIRPVVKV